MIIFSNLFSVSFAYSWRSNDYDYSFGHDDYYHHPHPFHYYKHPNDYSSCNCIRIKYCEPLRDLLRLAEKPLTEEFKNRVRKISCGFTPDKVALVCCPESVSSFDPRLRRHSFFNRQQQEQATEEPWVWDVETQKPNSGDKPYNPNQFFNLYPNLFNNFQLNGFGQNIVPNLPNNGFAVPAIQSPEEFYKIHFKNHKFTHFRPAFVDEHTKKNCPPSFSHEFEVPHTITGVTPDAPVFSVTSINPAISVLPPEISTPAPIEPASEPVDETLLQSRASKRELINGPLCGLSINTRIIGGEDAGPGQFPWMARLAYRNRSKNANVFFL